VLIQKEEVFMGFGKNTKRYRIVSGLVLALLLSLVLAACGGSATNTVVAPCHDCRDIGNYRRRRCRYDCSGNGGNYRSGN
jgi:hypothetical protein